MGAGRSGDMYLLWGGGIRVWGAVTDRQRPGQQRDHVGPRGSHYDGVVTSGDQDGGGQLQGHRWVGEEGREACTAGN